MTIDPPEIVEVAETVVACNGGGGALGHPRVFLNLESEGAIDCPYCDRRFVLKQGRERPAAFAEDEPRRRRPRPLARRRPASDMKDS